MHNTLDNLLVSVVQFEKVNKVLNVMDDDLRVLLTAFAESSLSFFLNFNVVQVFSNQRKQMLNELPLNSCIWLLDRHQILENPQVIKLYYHVFTHFRVRLDQNF